ncbi:MAG: hypothetical protein IT210_25370 [Armatimonadetes bacterium]|nr:hypothetical protein [Armatimonadota bacterium]
MPLMENPVLQKEMCSRMRGGRAFLALFVYISFLCGVLYFTYALYIPRASFSGASFWQNSMGRVFFIVLAYLQATLIMFICPALTAGAITLEKEQRTFEMLLLTLLRSRDIALGKLLSSLSYVALLLLSSLPLASLCFLFGAISPLEIAMGYLMMILFTLFFGACGLFWSSVFSRTSLATVFSYATTLFMVIGVYIISSIVFAMTWAVRWQGVFTGAGQPKVSASLAFFFRLINTASALTPYSLLSSLLLRPLFNMSGLASNPYPPYGNAFWNAFVFYILVSALLLKATMTRIRRPGR